MLDKRLTTALRLAQIGRHVLATLAECWTLAEIVYYYTHDGEQTLHGAAVERAREYIEYRREQDRAMREIRDLPER